MKEENEASENRAKHLSELQEVTGDSACNKTPSISQLRARESSCSSSSSLQMPGGNALNWFYLSTPHARVVEFWMQLQAHCGALSLVFSSII